MPETGWAYSNSPSLFSRSLQENETQSVTIQWVDSADDETGYRIYEYDQEDYKLIAEVGTNVTSFAQNNLACGNSVHYLVKSFNRWGESATPHLIVANTANCFVPLPDVPLLYDIFPEPGRTITVGWSTSDKATSYELQEKFNSSDWSTIYTGSDTIRYLASKDEGRWCYRVRAIGLGGPSDWSGTECVDITPLLSPTLHPIDNADGNANYDVSWSSMNGAGAYELQEKLGNNSWGTVQQSSATYKSFTDKPVGTYCYRVSAVYVDGSSGWSNEHCTSVLPAMPVLEAIDNADGDGSFSLRWTEVHDDYAYRIYESFNNVGFEEVDITFSNQYEVFDKAVGTWCYRVQAVYESLDSPLSAPRCTTVLEEGPVVPGNKLYLPATLKGAGGDTYLYS